MFNFTLTALLGPVFGSRLVQEGGAGDLLALAHCQAGFQPLLYGILVAQVLICYLKETSPGTRKDCDL